MHIIETIGLSKCGYLYLKFHLQRLYNSAKELDFQCDKKAINSELIKLKNTYRNIEGIHAIRLSLFSYGKYEISISSIEKLNTPVKLIFAEYIYPSNAYLIQYKTSHRKVYDAAWRLAESIGCFDAIFCNERAEITQGGRSNIFIKIQNNWFTPDITCGLLPGIMRAQLLTQLKAKEKILYKEDLMRVQNIIVCNSLRGVMPALITEHKINVETIVNEKIKKSLIC